MAWSQTFTFPQNQTLNSNNNRNNNGNRGRYRKQSRSEDLDIESRCDFRRARHNSSASNQETGSGGRGSVAACRRRSPLPVKVLGPTQRATAGGWRNRSARASSRAAAKEAADALGIGERTLRQILPELPHVRVGGAVLLPVEALRRWLEEQAKAEQGRAEKVAEEVLESVRCD